MPKLGCRIHSCILIDIHYYHPVYLLRLTEDRLLFYLESNNSRLVVILILMYTIRGCEVFSKVLTLTAHFLISFQIQVHAQFAIL